MIDRRLLPRVRRAGLRARVRTGHRLVVIDVSAQGALVEAARPLPPGSFVELHLESEEGEGRVAARVVRCDVIAISAESGITYRAGLAFNDLCAWVCESETQRGFDVPMESLRERLSPGRTGDELPEHDRGRTDRRARGAK